MIDDELSPDLRRLFDAERRRPDVDGPPPGAQQRVHAALLLSIAAGAAASSAAAASVGAGAAGASGASGAAAGGAAVGGAAVGGAAVGGAAAGGAAAGGAFATGGVVAKGLALALVAAMAGTTGTGIYLAATDDDGKQRPPAVEVVPAVDTSSKLDPNALMPKREEPVLERVEPVRPLPRVERTREPAPAAVIDPVEPTPEQRAERLRGERAVLDEARAAVARGDGDAALIALEAHRASYRDGMLVEEREALTVLALVKVGRVEQAKAKADAFKERWPKSLFLPALAGALP